MDEEREVLETATPNRPTARGLARDPCRLLQRRANSAVTQSGVMPLLLDHGEASEASRPILSDRRPQQW